MDYFIGTKFKLLFYFLCWSCWSVRFLVFSTPLSLTPSLPHSLTLLTINIFQTHAVCVSRDCYFYSIFAPLNKNPYVRQGGAMLTKKKYTFFVVLIVVGPKFQNFNFYCCVLINAQKTCFKTFLIHPMKLPIFLN